MAPILLISRWRCGVCCIEWDRPAMFDADPPEGCPGCSAHHIRRINAPPAVLPSIADAVIRDVEALLSRHLDDVSAMLACFLDAPTKLLAPLDVAELYAIVAAGGDGWAGEEAQSDDVSAFLRAHAGQRIRVRYEAVEEPRDTERPPPPASEAEFTPEEIGTFDPVVVPIGAMVGPRRRETPTELRWQRTDDDGFPKDGEVRS